MANHQKEESRQTCQYSKWSDDLSIEIKELILKKFASIDILGFKAVCSSWQHAATSYIASPYYKPLPQSPWIMLGKGQQDNNSRRFFSVEEKRVYTIKNILFQGRCVGSSNGWLVIMSNDNSNPDHLLNPVSGESIPFPDRSAYYDVPEFSSSSHILHVALNSEPSRENKFFLVIRTKKTSAIFQYILGNNLWHSSLLMSGLSSPDIAFQNGKLFKLLKNKAVIVSGLNECLNSLYANNAIEETWPVNQYEARDDYLGKDSCLVESLGEILRLKVVMAGRNDDDFSDVEFYFEVYKMSFTTELEFEDYRLGNFAWEKVENLGERFIIWCRKQSPIVLNCSDFTGFETNSIYYSYRGGIIMFNLEDKVVKPFYKFDEFTTDEEPFWIVPNISLN